MSNDENSNVALGLEDALTKESITKLSWDEVFALLDAANIPEDFMSDRDLEAVRHLRPDRDI